MPRARTIKPGFHKNEILASLNPLARILFQGLWMDADKAGRLEDRPKRIKAEWLPYDDCDADNLLESLHDHDFILRYVVDGKHYIQILTFTEHQNPHPKEKESVIPAPNLPTERNVITRQEPENPEREMPLPMSSSSNPSSTLATPAATNGTVIAFKAAERKAKMDAPGFDKFRRLMESTGKPLSEIDFQAASMAAAVGDLSDQYFIDSINPYIESQLESWVTKDNKDFIPFPKSIIRDKPWTRKAKARDSPGEKPKTWKHELPSLEPLPAGWLDEGFEEQPFK